MTVKILSSTSTFNGVSYNTNKTQSAKGELMTFRNFGYMQTSNKVTLDEMKTFLKVHSNRNTRVKNQQFHAMISCKEREYSKEQLTQMAEQWLQKMGYGDNPYLIVFHGDTKNNHVHMVSSRIGQDGKKINDSMERIRAQKSMQEILGQNPGQGCQKLIEKLKSFSFSTLSQAKLYLETNGYSLKEENNKLHLYKFGLQQGEIDLHDLLSKTISYSPDKARIKQLRSFFEKYRMVFNSSPVPIYEPLKGNRLGKQVGYRSEMSDFLKEKLGVELIFHGKEGKDPYGYTIIDHSKKTILKGSEVFPLKELIRAKSDQKIKIINFTSDLDKSAYQNITGTNLTIFRYKPVPRQSAYRLKLLSAFEEFPTLALGLEAFQLNLLVNQNRLYLLDGQEQFFIRLDSILKAKEYNCFARLWDVPMVDDQSLFGNRQVESAQPFNVQQDISGDFSSFQEIQLTEKEGVSEYSPTLPDFFLGISQDVDDEAMHGRKRKKDKNTKRNRA